MGIYASNLMLEGSLSLLIWALIAIEAVLEIEPWTTTSGAASLLRQTGLGVDDTVAASGGLDDIGVLFLEKGEVALSVPHPWRISGEEKIHLFERALVGFGVESPNHGKSDDVGGTEDVVGFLIKSCKHDRAKESL